MEPSRFNLDATTRSWHGFVNGFQLYVHRYRLVRIQRNLLLDKLVPVVGHNQMVCTDVELYGPTAGTNGFAINPRVSLLWAHRNLQLSWLWVLRKSNRTEQSCGGYR
jgi:hypothetical protein